MDVAEVVNAISSVPRSKVEEALDLLGIGTSNVHEVSIRVGRIRIVRLCKDADGRTQFENGHPVTEVELMQVQRNG